MEAGGRRGRSVVRTCVREQKRLAVSWGVWRTRATLKCPPPSTAAGGRARSPSDGGASMGASRGGAPRAHEPHCVVQSPWVLCESARGGGGQASSCARTVACARASAGCAPPVNGTPPSKDARYSAVGILAPDGVSGGPNCRPPSDLTRGAAKGVRRAGKVWKPQKKKTSVVLLPSQFWPIPSMSRRVINCATLCLSHPFGRIKWIRQWAVDRDPVLTSTTSAKIGKTAIVRENLYQSAAAPTASARLQAACMGGCLTGPPGPPIPGGSEPRRQQVTGPRALGAPDAPKPTASSRAYSGAYKPTSHARSTGARTHTNATLCCARLTNHKAILRGSGPRLGTRYIRSMITSSTSSACSLSREGYILFSTESDQ